VKSVANNRFTICRHESRRGFIKFGLSTVVCLLSSGTITKSVAEEPDASPTPDPIDTQIDKLREDAKSTQDMIEAETRGTALWDAELNRVYQALQKKLPESDQRKLTESQRAWLTFRDTNKEVIEIIYGRAQGTMYQPMAVSAELETVKERAVRLRRYLEILEEASSNN
jgi:uncharacterized protein YecT (DUF1311 family)